MELKNFKQNNLSFIKVVLRYLTHLRMFQGKRFWGSLLLKKYLNNDLICAKLRKMVYIYNLSMSSTVGIAYIIHILQGAKNLKPDYCIGDIFNAGFVAKLKWHLE